MTTYRCGIGIMSGTSLDGVDLAYCRFLLNDPTQYEILRAATIPYTTEMRSALQRATTMSAVEYCRLDVALGEVIAQDVNAFVGEGVRPDFLASHGHTIFHQPGEGLTTQIGSGAVIAARTGIRTVCDFRTADVALHGQGAPLVPIGDELLFGQYDACLNLGGFSNISYRNGQQRIAFDISACNMLLNHLANLIGLDFDPEGLTAQKGQIIESLLEELNQLPFFQRPAPKSLGKEWFEQEVCPILKPYTDHQSLADCLRTATEHIALQIQQVIPPHIQTLLVTGGGALNHFLIHRLQTLWGGQICLPDTQTILFKEALIFAFLGHLRLQNHINCLCSVTGADKDCCGGCVWEV